MINSVSFNTNRASTQRAQNKGVMPDLSRRNLSFGYGEQNNSFLDNVKYGFATLTNDVVGLVGFNALLWWIQSKVNGDLLVGKIHKHYTDKITDEEKAKFEPLAQDMLKIEHMDSGEHKVNVHTSPEYTGKAYFTERGNHVVVGPDNLGALYHEIGHAKIENNTTILKALQRFRGHYTPIALALYALMSTNRKQIYNPFGLPQEQGFGDKVKNFFSRSSLLIPLIAFSPELITEAMASKYGMNFLKKQVDAKKIPAALRKNIGKSYLACFGTYLFIPVSIILMEIMQNSLEKEVNKLRQKRMANQYY